MSTDDLTRRARQWASVVTMEPSTLLSKLADEVDGLREERDGWQTLRNEWRQTAHGLAAERDAARAALGRVRAVADQWDTLAEGYSNMFGNQVSISAAVAAERIYNALEGES